MVVISKQLFYSIIGPEVTCKSSYHEWTNNCLGGILQLNWKHFVPGVFYFYVPIYMIKLLIDRKKIDKNYMKKFLKNYLKSKAFGLTFGVLILNTVCLLNKISGRINYYNVGLIPGFISGFSIIFENEQNKTLNTVLWASLVVEAILKNSYYFGIIKYSPFKETVMFMLTSSLLMYLFENNQKKNPLSIWFYVPKKVKNLQLTDYAVEVLKYFGLGYGISSARSVIYGLFNLNKKPVSEFFKSILNKRHFRFGMFFGMFVALYQSSKQLLQKYNGKNSKNAAIAGFLAGLTYWIKPEPNILAIAIVTTLQILIEKVPQFPKKPRISPSTLIFMICNGILLHNRIMAEDTCPRYYKNMLRGASTGLFDNVYDSVINQHFDLQQK